MNCDRCGGFTGTGKPPRMMGTTQAMCECARWARSKALRDKAEDQLDAVIRSKPALTRVIGYVRVSSEEQAAGDSLAAQESRIRTHCASAGLELVRIEVDAGLSASTLAREGLGRALAAVGRAGVSGLVVTKLDRLTRSVADLCDLRRTGGLGTSWALTSLDEKIDTESPMGNAFLQILTVFAELERKTTGARTRDLLAFAKAKGQPLGGTPYGWKLVKVDRDATGRRVGPPGRLERDEDQQRVIAGIVQQRTDGSTLGAIAARLNHQRTPGAMGGQWTATSIRRVLKASAAQAA